MRTLNATERTGMVKLGLSLARDLNLPLIVVAETWAGKMTGQTYAGLGAEWGAWREQLEIAGHDMKAIARIQVAEWRKTIHGIVRLKGSGTTAAARRKDATRKWKQLSVRWVKAAFDIDVGDDEAEAICLGMAAIKGAKITGGTLEDVARKAEKRMKKRMKGAA